MLFKLILNYATNLRREAFVLDGAVVVTHINYITQHNSHIYRRQTHLQNPDCFSIINMLSYPEIPMDGWDTKIVVKS